MRGIAYQMLRLSVIALLVVLVSCGGSKSAMKAPAPQASAGGAEAGPIPPTPHEEIERLDYQITLGAGELRLEEPMPDMIDGAPKTPMGAMTPESDPKCHPPQNDTCKTSCTLSTSVCRNADKICTLANSMAGDNWAMNKCARANLMCEASHKKCCACQ
jgi:hypothetical protein